MHIEQSTRTQIIRRLRAWYHEKARQLPWRETRDPYAIWVSEIMLQQTRVEAVIPYYQRWMQQFPTLHDLAEASQDQVLKAWEGLGYYSRARNLQDAARTLVEQHGGELPRDPKALQRLPGIGRYTAGAISSIAFGIPTPILDGNLRRVFSRLFSIDSPLGTTQTETILWEIAAALVSERDPGTSNQALMELGALICRPLNPACGDCPLNLVCLARASGTQNALPVRKEKRPVPHHQVAAAVIQNGPTVLLAKRPAGGLLGGLWEFPGGKMEPGESLPEALKREIREELNLEIEVGDRLGRFQHAYTHYKVTLEAFFCRQISQDLQLNYHTEIAWISSSDLETYPMGKLDRLITRALQQKSA